MDTGLADGHIPCVDDFSDEVCFIIDVILTEGRTHEAVVVNVLALYRQHPFAFRNTADIIPFAFCFNQTVARNFFENIEKESGSLCAFALEFSAMGPPENAVLRQICFAMSGIAASDSCFPESSDHFLGSDIAPAVLDVAFVGNLIHDNRFVELLCEFAGQFRAFVEINSLDGAVCDPRTVVVVHHAAVVNGTQMSVYILLNQNGRIALPVRDCLFLHEVILIGQRPPYIAVCAEAGNDVFPVEIILFRAHFREAPSVIRMHADEICLNAALAEFLDAVFQMTEIFRIETCVIEVVAFALSAVLHEVLIVENGGIHRCSLIRIASRLAQVECIVLRENAEAHFVEACFFQRLQCLCDQLIRLQRPYIGGCSDGIVRCAVLIGEMMRVDCSDRTMVAFFRSDGIERAGQTLFKE